MHQIIFHWDGTNEEIRSLDPGPAQRWGHWTATNVNGTMIGTIYAEHPNVRDHTHEKMTMMPHNLHNPLSDHHISAFNKAGIKVKKGDTLHVALSAAYDATGCEFLHPDRF